MDKERPGSSSPYRQTVTLPPFLDRLALRVAHLPWWAIIIGVGLVLIFYTFLTNDFYRATLSYLTGDPALITDRYQNVIYEINAADGTIQQIQGFVTAQDANTVTLIRSDKLVFNIPRGDVGTISCVTPGADGNCPLATTVTVIRSTISGKLLIENIGDYRIQTDDGNVYKVVKYLVDTKNVQRNPADCTSRPDTTCRITLPLKPTINPDDEKVLAPEEKVNVIKGTLIGADASHIVVEVVSPILTINRSDILRVVGAKPGQCALNNLTGCNTGIFLTITVTLSAFLLAIVAGLFLALMRISSDPILFTTSTIYVEVIRGTPLVVIMLFFGFGIAIWFRDNFAGVVPGLWLLLTAVVAGALTFYLALGLRRYARSRHLPEPMPLFAVFQPILLILIGAAIAVLITGFFAANSNISLEMRGVIALTICYSAYLSELFRAGIQSIPRGQMEAARSQGLTYVQAMRYVIIPQAFRVVLPPLGNEFIAMLKDTSLLVVLSIPELTYQGRQRTSDTLRVIEVYATVAVLYLCMTLFLSFMVRVTERRTGIPR